MVQNCVFIEMYVFFLEKKDFKVLMIIDILDIFKNIIYFKYCLMTSKVHINKMILFKNKNALFSIFIESNVSGRAGKTCASCHPR